MILVIGSAIPEASLAFEADLNHARKSASQYIAHKVFAGEETQVAQAPDYSNRLVNVATAPMTVMTEETQAEPPKPAPVPARRVLKKEPRNLPNKENPLVLEGEASFYSRTGCLGCSPNLTMANGQPLNDQALTMAIGADKSYLVGRQAKVTNLVTGKSVEVKITDTGGFFQAKYGRRVADLTVATKQAIGMNGGVGQVKVEVY